MLKYRGGVFHSSRRHWFYCITYRTVLLTLFRVGYDSFPRAFVPRTTLAAVVEVALCPRSHPLFLLLQVPRQQLVTTCCGDH